MKRIWHILLIVFTVAIISGTDSYAKSVLVIDNINEKAVRELDSRLRKKESFTLLIPGSKNDFKKNLRQVNTLLGKVNKQGVVLRCSLQKQNGKYCQIKVSSEQAKTYVYACKFINELFDPSPSIVASEATSYLAFCYRIHYSNCLEQFTVPPLNVLHKTLIEIKNHLEH